VRAPAAAGATTQASAQSPSQDAPGPGSAGRVQVPGVGAPNSALLFEPRVPGSGQIQQQAEAIRGWADPFDSLSSDIVSRHDKAKAGVEGDPATGMSGAADEAVQQARDMKRRAAVAAGALHEFAIAVEAFNRRVDEWNAEILAASNHGIDQEAAREARSKREQEYQDREELRDAAQTVRARLEGWRDDDTLRDLVDARALPSAVAALFPGLKFDSSGIAPVIGRLIDRGLLPDGAQHWDAGRLREYLVDNPDVARRLTQNTPDSFGPVMESRLAELLSPNGDMSNPQQRQSHMDKVREFFDSLDGDDAAKLAMLFPAQVGNLNGAPFAHRADANRVAVSGARVEAKATGNQERLKLYNDILANDRQIILFNSDGDGKIAELHGAIDADTQNVGTLVPGTGTHIGNFDTTVKRAERFRDAGGKELAMISWLGGDMPDRVTNAVSAGYYADGMAADLAGFSDALRQEINHSAAADNSVNTTFAGHSYGGATVGAAEQHGLDANRVLHISSAGLGSGIGSPTDLPDSQDQVDRYSITPDDDVLMKASRPFLHGGNPDTEVTRLESGDYRVPGQASGHAGTLDEYGSIAWWAAVDTFTGDIDATDEYDPGKHAPGGQYGPPEHAPRAEDVPYHQPGLSPQPHY